jgi:hypothetical protein
MARHVERPHILGAHRTSTQDGGRSSPAQAALRSMVHIGSSAQSASPNPEFKCNWLHSLILIADAGGVQGLSAWVRLFDVWGLYRVNFRDGNEVTARYRINGEDAFNTGTAMAQYEPWHRHELAVRPRGDGIVIPERFPPEIITFTLPGGSNAHDPAQAPVVTMTLGSPARRARQPRLDDRLPEERHAAA